MKIPLNLSKIKKTFKKLPRILAERFFLAFLALLLLVLILGSLVFYQYVIRSSSKEIKVFQKPFRFNESVHRQVLKIWQERQKKFEEAETKEYPDPFAPLEVKNF